MSAISITFDATNLSKPVSSSLNGPLDLVLPSADSKTLSTTNLFSDMPPHDCSLPMG